MATTFTKDPDAVLDYVFDWSDWFTGSETISSYVLTVSAGLTLDSSSNTATKVTAWISGGTSGTPYTLACRITTDAGRVDERSVTIRVTQR